MIKKIISFCRLVKIEHTVFALPFLILTLIVLQYYENTTNLQRIVWIFIAFGSARAIGMALNRIIDYYIDFKNPRTQKRPLQKKELTLTQAYMFLSIFVALYIYSAYSINRIVFKLSPLLLLYMVFYSYTKRFTYLCHFILGSVHAMLPFAISLALYEYIYFNLVFLSTGIMFLIAGSDIIYALLDMEFDKKEKLFSIPSKFGQTTSIFIALISYLISLLSFAIFFAIMKNHLWIYSYLAIFLSFIVIIVMVLKLKKDKIFIAEKVFFMNNVIVAILLTSGTLIDYYLQR